MRFYILFVLLLSSRLIFCQNEKKDAIRITIVYTNAYAKGYSEKTGRQSDIDNYEALINEYDKNKIQDINDYYELLLKTNWTEAKNKIAKPTYKNILEILNSNENSKSKILIPEWLSEAARADLDSSYKVSIVKICDSLNSVENSGNTEGNEGSQKAKKSKGKNRTSSFFSFTLNISHIILITLFLLGLLISNNMRKKRDKRKDISKGRQYEEVNKQLQESKARNESLLTENKKLKTKVEELEFSLEQSERRNSKVIEDKLKIPIVQDPISKHKKIIRYYPSPSGSGTFRIESASTSARTNITFYRFELESESATTAKVYFEPADDMSRTLALNSPDSYIFPVCLGENPLNQQARKIETVRPGTARKNGDLWEIREEDKVLIKYI
jgi:hypothetical protein